MAMRDQLQQMANETKVVELLSEPPTVRCSASNPLLVDAALDLAAGMTPSLAWAVTTDSCVFLAMRGFQNRKAIVLSFPSPQSDAFIERMVRDQAFILDVEGCIPVRIHTPLGHQSVIGRYLNQRGWL